METNKNDNYTLEQDKLIIQHVCTIGKKWKKIALSFDGKTANSIENRWNRFLKFEIIKNPHLLDCYSKKEVEAGIGLLNLWKESCSKRK